jgi:hypothetical protein
MTATAKLDLLDEFSECPVPKADRSLDQQAATGSSGSGAGIRFVPPVGRYAAHTRL